MINEHITNNLYSLNLRQHDMKCTFHVNTKSIDAKGSPKKVLMQVILIQNLRKIQTNKETYFSFVTKGEVVDLEKKWFWQISNPWRQADPTKTSGNFLIFGETTQRLGKGNVKVNH